MKTLPQSRSFEPFAPARTWYLLVVILIVLGGILRLIDITDPPWIFSLRGSSVIR